MVEGGLLTQKQLEQALPFQKKSNLKLGQFLVREGIVNESQIVDLVSTQLRLEKYRPDQYTIDVDLANLLPAEIAHKYQVAPIQKNGLLLTIAMMDPLDINAVDCILLGGRLGLRGLRRRVGQLHDPYPDHLQHKQRTDAFAADTAGRRLLSGRPEQPLQ